MCIYISYKCYYWLVRVDAGGHSGLPALVLGSAYVSSKVDGLQVINGHDALGDAGGVSHSSVDQPPRITHTNRTKVLNRQQSAVETITKHTPQPCLCKKLRDETVEM
uniref:Uncharacterized protein n=1 Tax=Salmo trutta TaxID=8032 RepID=A0A674D012_SALTR